VPTFNSFWNELLIRRSRLSGTTLGRQRQNNVASRDSVYLAVLRVSSWSDDIPLWRSVRRGVREFQSRGRILVAAGTALAVWAASTYYMFAATFVTAWGVAHMRPVPAGMFPEGWMIYGLLAAHTMLGATLVFIVGKMPRKRAAA